MRGTTKVLRRTGNERRTEGTTKMREQFGSTTSGKYNKRTREEEREQDREETKKTRKYTHVRGEVEYRIAGKTRERKGKRSHKQRVTAREK